VIGAARNQQQRRTVLVLKVDAERREWIGGGVPSALAGSAGSQPHTRQEWRNAERPKSSTSASDRGRSVKARERLDHAGELNRPLEQEAVPGVGEDPDPGPQAKMLTARATMMPTVTSAATLWMLIRSLMRGVSGIASVGLNAVWFVSET
jgi:hypothetical protein